MFLETYIHLKKGGFPHMATKKTAAQEAADKALAAAKAKKKVEHTYTQVGQQSTSTEELLAATKANAMPFRIGAIVCWILALACEVFAILFFTIKLDWGFLYNEPGHTIAWIAALVLDLILVVVGSLLWKKGNHLDPAKKSQPVKFWLQNNLGVIVTAVAFIPFVIFALTDKNATKKSKTLAAIAAAVAIVVGTLFGIDWNPISQEELLENAGTEIVYWTASGTVYHLYDDCYHLNNTVDLLTGTATSAVENGKTRVCKNCEKKAAEHAAEKDANVPDNGEEKPAA